MTSDAIALVTVLLAWPFTLAAQQSAAEPDSARAQIRTTLQAFYFNLGRRDWEAVTADILPAKVVAHRAVPDVPVTAGASPARTAGFSSVVADDPVACPSKAGALVNRATITVDRDWAVVSVPRCTRAPARADEFRLIHFDRRWRFVYIHLFQEPVTLPADQSRASAASANAAEIDNRSPSPR